MTPFAHLGGTRVHKPFGSDTWSIVLSMTAGAAGRAGRIARLVRVAPAWRRLLLALCLAWGLVLALPAASLAEAAARDVSLAHKGLTLMGRLVIADGKSLADGVILITHGTLAHNRMEVIGAMQTALAERGQSSLAITLSLGIDKRRGMYDCGAPHRHRHTDALDEIGAWIGWLEGQGAKRIVLMGHSRGGNQTAWFAAERARPSVSHVVLLAPMRFDFKRVRATYKERYGERLTPLLKKAKGLEAAGQPDAFLENVGFLYCKGARVTAEAFLSYYAPDDRRDTPRLLKKIKVPVLVIVGSEDKVVAGLEEAVAPIAKARPNVKLQVIEDADHFFRDFYAEDAADAIVEFLGGDS